MLIQFLKDEEGVSVVELGMIAGILVVVLITITFLGLIGASLVKFITS